MCRRELMGARGGDEVWPTVGRQGCGTYETALGAKHGGRSTGVRVEGEPLGAVLTAGPRRGTVRKAWPPAGIAGNEESSKDSQKDLRPPERRLTFQQHPAGSTSSGNAS